MLQFRKRNAILRGDKSFISPLYMHTDTQGKSQRSLTAARRDG